MSDTFEDLQPPDPRASVHRAIEGLSVVAVIVAVVLWQSDATLDAARQLLGFGEQPHERAVAAMQPLGSDIRLYPTPTEQPRPAEGAVDTSIRTGSIAPTAASPPATSPPVIWSEPSIQLRRAQPAAPMVSSAAPAAEAASGPAAFSPAPVSVVRSISASPPAMAEDPPASRWTVACDQPGDAFCKASQAPVGSDDPDVGLSWTIERRADGLFAVWTAPGGIRADRGMVLTMGDGAPKTVPFTACDARSCEIRARLAGDFVALLRRSPQVSTEIVLESGRSVRFTFTREGLDEALAKLGA